MSCSSFTFDTKYGKKYLNTQNTQNLLANLNAIMHCKRLESDFEAFLKAIYGR